MPEEQAKSIAEALNGTVVERENDFAVRIDAANARVVFISDSAILIYNDEDGFADENPVMIIQLG